MKKKIIAFKNILWLCGLFLFTNAEAQLDNTSFYNTPAIDSSQIGAVDIRIENFNFLKNNEYYTNIVDGSTFFGFHFKPTLSYQPGKNFRLNAGMFLWQDFGNTKFSNIAPIFTFSYQKNNHSLNFGNISGPLQHLYIEPLMNFERVIHSPLENGIQYVFSNEKVFLDFWINWKKALYRGQQTQEKIRAGISALWEFYKSGKNMIRIPVQAIFSHSGGQISPTPIPVSNYVNTALGVELSRRLNQSHLRDIIVDFYFVQSLDYSSQPVWPFKAGQGFYSNLTLESKYLTCMLSYWNSQNFITVQGGELYSSLSSSVRNVGYTENTRNLLLLRLIRDFHISDNLIFTLRIEPYWDIQNRLLEYSFGFYINYRDIFRINTINN